MGVGVSLESRDWCGTGMSVMDGWGLDAQDG